MRSRRWHTVAWAALAAAVACGRARDVDTQPRPALHVPPPASASVDAAVASAPDAGPVEPDSPSSVAFLSDGTLVVVGRRTLLARAADGTTKRRRLDEASTVEYAPDARGVVIRTDAVVELVATPSLAPLYMGAGTPLVETPSALAVDEGRAVVLQQGEALMRLAVPSQHQGAQPVAVQLVARGARFNLSYASDDANGFSGTLFDAKDGAVVGTGFSGSRMTAMVPLVAITSDAAFVVKGDRLSRVDLLTAKPTRQATIACGKDRVLGNPTPSPSGNLVLVTCSEEGIVLDGASLQVLRRVPNILPGCDNGNYLGGAVAPDNRTLVLSGCGGQAKVDIVTGRYVCGDGAGIVGGPYEIVPIRGPNGQFAPPRAPSGRDKLPRCTKEGQAMTIGASGRYRVVYGEHVTLESDGARPIVLEQSAIPTIAPDERLVAYARGDVVVVRALPAGDVVVELRLAP